MVSPLGTMPKERQEDKNSTWQVYWASLSEYFLMLRIHMATWLRAGMLEMLGQNRAQGEKKEMEILE